LLFTEALLVVQAAAATNQHEFIHKNHEKVQKHPKTICLN